jgi:hypothetical protein
MSALGRGQRRGPLVASLACLQVMLASSATPQECRLAREDMTSEHVAAIVIGEGGSAALVEQVRGSALDGGQLARFPMLEQLVTRACGGSAPAQSPEPSAGSLLPETASEDTQGQDGCLAIEYPPGEVHEIDDFEEAAERLVIVLRINCPDVARASTLTRAPLPSRYGKEGATELDRMTYDLGHEVMNMASYASDVVHLQIPLRRGRWRSAFTLHREDGRQESAALEVGFFRLMDARLSAKFPPHHAVLDSLSVSPASLAAAQEQALFVFYKGVVPFVMTEALEPEGVRDKFGPPAFYINMTLFQDAQTEWRHVYSMAYFCASQIQLPQGLEDGLYKVRLELLDYRHSETGQVLDRFLRVDASRDFPPGPAPAALESPRSPLFACAPPAESEGCNAGGGAGACSGHGECIEGWCHCWGNFVGPACQTDLETEEEYLPEYASDGGTPAWQCAQVLRWEEAMAPVQQHMRRLMSPAAAPAPSPPHRQRPAAAPAKHCHDVVVFAADVSSAFGTTMRALALAVSRGAVRGKPVAMAPGWHFLLHPACPEGHLSCYFEHPLECSPDSDGASDYVPYFAQPCPNALMPAAGCAAQASHLSPPAASLQHASHVLLEAHEPPVLGRGVGGGGVGGFLDVHGRERGDAGRAGVLRLVSPPRRLAALPRQAGAARMLNHSSAHGDEGAEAGQRVGELLERRGSMWWMALTLDLLLRPNEALRSQQRAARAAAGLGPGTYVGLHVRHGDACGNNGRRCLAADAIAHAVVRMCDRYKQHQVFIATDSPDMVDRLRGEAPHIRWLSVPADRSQGSGSTLLGEVWPQMLRTRMGLLDRHAVCEVSFLVSHVPICSCRRGSRV